MSPTPHIPAPLLARLFPVGWRERTPREYPWWGGGLLKQAEIRALPDLGVIVSFLTWCRPGWSSPATFATPPTVEPHSCTQPSPRHEMGSAGPWKPKSLSELLIAKSQVHKSCRWRLLSGVLKKKNLVCFLYRVTNVKVKTFSCPR